MARFRESAGLGDPSRSVTRISCWWRRVRVLWQRLMASVVLGVGEQGQGPGEQLAGDRGGGDLLAVAAGECLVAGGELRRASAACAAAQDPTQPGRAPDVAVADGAVRAADGGGEPGPGGELGARAEPGDEMSPTGEDDQGGERATPGSWVRTLTRGSDLARWRTSQSSRSIGTCRASIRARSSSITSRDTAGRSSEASQARPGLLQQLLPVLAVVGEDGWIRSRSRVRNRTSSAVAPQQRP